MLEIGTILEDRYRLIATGTSQDLGLEYKAHDIQCDRLVIVLMLPPGVGSTGDDVLARLSRVQQAVADLSQPGLIPFEHVGQVEGRMYLVRSHVEGQSLAELLSRSGPLEVGMAVSITIGLCEALALAHRSGMVHGSLSPHSLLVRGDGRDLMSRELSSRAVAILDTALLPALRPVPASRGQPWGRSPYLSPEQAAGEDVQPASDVYVVGSLLYEMLTGRPPFRAGDETVLALQHLRHEPPSLQILRPHVPLPLAQIVHKALAKEPAARYRNAGQLAHILRTQLGALLASRPPGPAAPRQAPSQERLVVPPPPAPSPPSARPGVGMYDRLAEIDEWSEEPADVDWLMVGLIVVALIAVLGLIPLWRTVHRRYTVPRPTPVPTLRGFLGQDSISVLFGVKDRQDRTRDRDNHRFKKPLAPLAAPVPGAFAPRRGLERESTFPYNKKPPSAALASLAAPIPGSIVPRTGLRAEEESPSLGVKLTGSGHEL